MRRFLSVLLPFIQQRSPHYKAISYYDLGWVLGFINSWLPRLPSVRQMSFRQILPNLLHKHCGFFRNFGALMWCGILPYLHSLVFGSCSSVPTFAVSLTSVHGSPQTTLRLANVSGINPAHSGLTPYGLCFCHFLFLFLHRDKKTKTFQSAIQGTHIVFDLILFVPHKTKQGTFTVISALSKTKH